MNESLLLKVQSALEFYKGPCFACFPKCLKKGLNVKKLPMKCNWNSWNECFGFCSVNTLHL